DASTSTATSLTVAPATPFVSLGAPRAVYDGSAHGATQATVTAGNVTLAIAGDTSLSYTYYVGATASGTGSAVAPTDAGTYTVVAHWTSNNSNYADADSAPASFTIDKADARIRVTSYSGTYDGQAHGLGGTATGAQGEDLGSLLTLGGSYRTVGTY